jgi:hypothetical protein
MQKAALDQCSPDSDYGMEVPLTWSDFQEAMLTNKGKHLPPTRENVAKNESVSPVCTPSKVLCDDIEGNPERIRHEQFGNTTIQPRCVRGTELLPN